MYNICFESGTVWLHSSPNCSFYSQDEETCLSEIGTSHEKKPLVNALWSLNNNFLFCYHNIYFVNTETSDTEFQAESGNYLFTMFRFRPTNCKYTYNESNTPNQCISNKDCLCLCFSTFSICITTTVLMFSLVRGCDYFSGR